MSDEHPLGFLIGTWIGEGKGEYPTIDAFSYGEEITFRAPPGKPFLAYAQRTWKLGTDVAMHAETGYWRPVAGGRLEIVLAHPFGVVEIQEGTVSGTVVDVRSIATVPTSTAKHVAEVRRRVVVDGDVLRYELSMAAVGVPLTHHLSAELRRTA